MSRISQFLLGLKQLGDGFAFLGSHKKLWPWVLIPSLLGLTLLFVSWTLFIHYFQDLTHFLLQLLGFDHWTSTFQGSSWLAVWIIKPILWFLKWLLQILMNLLVFILGLLVTSLFSFLIYLIVAAPFLDLLAEKTTFYYKGEEPPSFQWKQFLKTILQTIAVEAQKAFLFLLVPLVFWVINFIPGVGVILYLLLTYLFGMWGLAFLTVDYPMGHQGIPFKERLLFAWKHKLALLGFGTPFLIPFAPLLLQAPMVVGGTLLYHKLKEATPSQHPG